MLSAAVLLAFAQTPSDRTLTVYSPQATYSLALVERGGSDYVELFALVEPLGGSVKVDGETFRFSLRGEEAEFEGGKSRARVRRTRFELSGKLWVENGRAYLPFNSLAALLARWTGDPVDFRESTRRLFLNTTPTTFTSEMKATEPASLALNFSAPVNPEISSSDGRLHIRFRREPLVGATRLQPLGTKGISTLSYAESSGTPELVITGTLPLQAAIAADGRSILVTPIPQPAAAPPNAAAQTPAPPTELPGAATQPEPGKPGAPSPVTRPASRYVVVIDPAHGGTDNGVKFSPDLAEKDVTLAVARRVRQELSALGITAVLLRDSDKQMEADERAALANSLRPELYVALHADSARGSRVYTNLLTGENKRRGAFFHWSEAQPAFSQKSNDAAALAAEQLLRRNLNVVRLQSALPPLRHIVAPAIAIEMGPGDGRSETLRSPSYQAAVGTAVAGAIAQLRRGVPQ